MCDGAAVTLDSRPPYAVSDSKASQVVSPDEVGEDETPSALAMFGGCDGAAVTLKSRPPYAMWRGSKSGSDGTKDKQ